MRRSVPALLALLTVAPAFADGHAPERLAPGDHELTLEHGGRSRWALVHVPPAAREGKPLPALIVYHGGGGEPLGMQAHAAGLDALADQEGFLVVYPAGTGPFERRLLTWNAGSCCGSAAREDVDDVGFTVALLERLARRAPVDPTRVYASGLSNGAMMSYRLAVDAPERVAAIAPVAGAMVAVLPAKPRLPVPVIHFHSVDDPRALYQGGLGPPFPLTRTRVNHPPVARTLAWWADANGCPPEPAGVGEPVAGAPGSASEGHTARRIRWGPGKDGAEVVHWKMTTVGHVWPGGPAYASERLAGPATAVIDANREMWGFLRRFTRAGAPALDSEAR